MNFLFGILVMGGIPVKGVFTPQPSTDVHLIQLRSRTIDTRSALLMSEKSSDSDTPCRFIVHFNQPLGSTDRELLRVSNLKIESYLPNSGFLVYGLPASAKKLLAQGSIDWYGSYLPEDKIDQALFDKAGENRVSIMLFPGANLTQITYELEEIGAEILKTGENEWNAKIIANMKTVDLVKAASIDGIRWIEPDCDVVLLNNRAQWVLQTWKNDNRRIWDKGLHGEGIITSTCDTGVNTEHVMFKDSSITISTWGDYPDHRKVVAYKPNNSTVSFGDVGGVMAFHGTHTGCSVCGDDSYWKGGSSYDGLAPKARLYFMDFDGTYAGISMDYRDIFKYPWTGNAAGKAKLMSNSWGSGTGYSTHAWECDQYMWENPDFLLMFSAGNEYTVLRSPGTAKNMVTVGATGNAEGANYPADFSSSGPAPDGRVKPDIMAPGQNVMSADGATLDSYKSMDGTSMACPVAAGATALIVQYLREGWFPSGNPVPSDSIEPSAALLKAMLVASTDADFYSRPIPDAKIGWGRVDLDSILFFESDERRLYLYDEKQGLSTGDYMSFEIEIQSNDWPLRAALVWTDAPPELSASLQLVNNLDMEVYDPSGKLYLGNHFENNYSTTGGSADLKNVVEMVRIQKPAAGTWSVRVKASETPEGPQPFALVVTGDIEYHDIDLRASGMWIDDSEAQNPNGGLDPGESVTLHPEITNFGSYTAEDITATLSTEENGITITGGEATYETLTSGAKAYGSGFKVNASNSLPADKVIAFQVEVEANDGNYAAVLEYPVTVSLGIDEDKTKPVLSLEISKTIMKNTVDVRLTLPKAGPLRIDMFDNTGRLVKTLLNESFVTVGRKEFKFNLNDASGCLLPSGIYFFRLKTADKELLCKGLKIE